ncbi:MAG: hypothetical protein HYV36_05735 [Lentisphaerae bacterium]|nr:hypothetical protein [Lentisphaerota bacterium]
MKNWRSDFSRQMYLAVALVLSVLLVGGLTGSDNIGIGFNDSDGDRMPDDYEIFYGLNPTNPADAAQNYDGDLLSNLEESRILTDPFSPDTDRDLIFDHAETESGAISRAYIQWGWPRFTIRDYYDYAHPDFLLWAKKQGGAWYVDAATTQSAWIAYAEIEEMPSLDVALDRLLLTNNLVYAIHYWDQSQAALGLHADLLTTNSEVIAADLYGNLLGGSNAEDVVYLAVPTAQFPDATIIRLRVERAPGASSTNDWAPDGNAVVMVYRGMLYIDEDFDGLDAETERSSVYHTSDYAVDTDGNGVSDYAQWMFSNGTNGLPFPGGGGGGGSTNDTDGGTSAPTGRIFVDKAIGSPMLTGRAPEVRGNDGPKKTISEGLAAVDRDGAHTLIIKSGAYGEDLDLRGKHFRVVIEGRVKL